MTTPPKAERPIYIITGAMDGGSILSAWDNEDDAIRVWSKLPSRQTANIVVRLINEEVFGACQKYRNRLHQRMGQIENATS